MSKKIISYVLVIAMVLSVFCFPIVGYGATTKVPRVAGVKSKAISSKTIKVSWKRAKNVDGYAVLQWVPSKNKYGVAKRISSGKTTSYKKTGFSAYKKYQFKVVAYKVVNGKKQYGKRSNYTRVRTKHSSKTKGVAIVNKAKSRLGKSYRSGASGPNAFDCSGLVYWVYKSSGVSVKKKVKRTSSAGLYSSLRKYKVGSTTKSAKPGDILLFKRGGRFGHAAIYAGKGKIVHAATPRKGVCKAKVSVLNRTGTRLSAVIRVV
ncbi:MAG: NlpC/P60 family protein [Anaerovoracaceae bacterium]